MPRTSGRKGERRRHKRGFATIPVTYGPEEPEFKAVARRLSIRGFFIDTNQVVYADGSTINLELEIGGKIYRAVGVVRHALKVDVRFSKIKRPGMGVELIDMDKDLKEAIAGLI